MRPNVPSVSELNQGLSLVGDDAAFAHAVTSLFRAFSVVSAAQAPVLGDLHLSLSQFSVLSALERTADKSLGLTSLSRLTLSHPATLTYTLISLEKKGLLTRTTAMYDRRAVVAQITPKGRRLIQKAFARLAEVRWGMVGVSADQARQLIDLLSQVDVPAESEQSMA